MSLDHMTPDAAAALDRAGFSRRSFLKGSGALIVGFSMAGVAGRFGLDATVEAQGPAPAADRRNQLDAWIAVAADGTIVAYTGKCELGQGLFTVQTQLVAEVSNACGTMAGVALARVYRRLRALPSRGQAAAPWSTGHLARREFDILYRDVAELCRTLGSDLPDEHTATAAPAFLSRPPASRPPASAYREP